MKNTRRQAFTLVEVMIVTGVIAIVVAIAVPTWLRQREIARGRNCQENLSKIDGAKELYALEFKLTNGSSVTMDELIRPGTSSDGEGYLKATPDCPAGGTYTTNVIGTDPVCSISDSVSPFEPHILNF